MEAKSILGECALIKANKRTGHKILHYRNYGCGPTVEVYDDEIIETFAYASILDKNLFVYADTRSILGE